VHLDGRYPILSDGPFTVVAALWASDDERLAACSRPDAHRMLRDPGREAARGDRRDLIGVHRLLGQDDGPFARRRSTEHIA
jgi:hypothetical protein